MNAEKIDASGPPAVAESPRDPNVAWEQLEPGRFKPRRIRGSDRGRALG